MHKIGSHYILRGGVFSRSASVIHITAAGKFQSSIEGVGKFGDVARQMPGPGSVGVVEQQIGKQQNNHPDRHAADRPGARQGALRAVVTVDVRE